MPVFDKPSVVPTPRRRWDPPTGKAVGTISEILQGGMGKLSPTGKDPGEARKVPSQDGG